MLKEVKNSLPKSTDFFTKNREKLAQFLEADSLAIISAASLVSKSSDLNYPFHQNTSFYYFTGILEPDCLLLLLPSSKINKFVTTKKNFLFIPPISPKKEQWSGEMLNKEKAQSVSGVENVMKLEDFWTVFQAQQNWKKTLYIENNIIHTLPKFSQVVQKIQKQNPALEIKKLDFTIASLRAKKQSVEILQIQKAIDITQTALEKIFQKIKDKKINNEKQIAAELTYQYQLQSSEGHAFNPIVASGKNAITLHYEDNNQSLKSEDLLLIDTGAMWGMYNSDITRVIPISGKFTDKQKFYYELVLEMQLQIIDTLKIGMSWWELYQKADKIQAKILKKAKIIQNETEQKSYTVHRIGHPLGLDVHDIYNQDDKLEEGNLLTIEPGLYLPEENIGIRIEDDILLTKKGIKNLSSKIPKTVKEIETSLS